MIATLTQIQPRSVDLRSRMEASIAVIRRNIAEIEDVCRREETVAHLRQRLNTLFRPLLLDGITMLQLLGETPLAQRFTTLQHSLLNALRGEADRIVRLGEYLSADELAAAAKCYIDLIQQELAR